METRLSLAMLKNLPQAVRQPVVEGSMSSSVRCLLLFESLHERYAPGGREELESIQRYLRQLPAASDFKAAMTTMRRWKLARGRAQSLGLPEQAPNESIAAWDSLMKIIEKRNTQLAMKLNLLRMQPDIIIPATSGLERYINLLEVECRRLASDQEVRDARAAHSSEEVVVAAEAAAKGKGRVCFHFGKPGGCWRGADCPFVHQEASKGGKVKAKGRARTKVPRVAKRGPRVAVRMPKPRRMTTRTRVGSLSLRRNRKPSRNRSRSRTLLSQRLKQRLLLQVCSGWIRTRVPGLRRFG